MEFIAELKPEKTNAKPRYQCKNWFLTFPQCEIPKQTVLDRLLACDAVQVGGVVIAQETHEDEGTIDARWLEIRLNGPIDLDNIIWPDAQEDSPVNTTTL